MTEPGPGILVPVKRLDRSKTRLAPLLGSDQRRELTRRLFDHLCSVLRDLPSRYSRAVISRDRRVEDRLRDEPLHYLEEPGGLRTLGEVVDYGARGDWYPPGRGLLVLPLDLPLLTTESLEAFLAFCEERPVVLNPDSSDRGTNALWRRPADRFPCQYEGTESFSAHRRAARGTGVQPVITRDSRIRVDLDTPADLLALYRSTHTLPPGVRRLLVQYRDRFTWRATSR